MMSRAAAILVLQCISMSALCVLSYEEVTNEVSVTDAGQWGEWSPWLPCSANCSSGLTLRSRRCLHPHHPLRTSEEDVHCSGNKTEMKICNSEVCTEGKKSWREEECSKYDSSIHAGKNYTWEPFVHPSDPCKLTCRAKGHHFYTNLADRVVDGTPCRGATTNPTAVCIEGDCKEVGCDGVVGSPWRRDACGVCKGDNRTCRTLAGIFSRADLGLGFHLIVVIPKGATQVNVSGLRHSGNWLAVKNPVTGTYVFNGGSVQSLPGEYEAGGTIFTLGTGKACPGQCIAAQGPTDQALHLVLNTRGRNRGVMYSFNLPNVLSDVTLQAINDSTSLRDTAVLPRDPDDDEARDSKRHSDESDREKNETTLEASVYDDADANFSVRTNVSNDEKMVNKKPVVSVVVPLKDLLEPVQKEGSNQDDAVNASAAGKRNEKITSMEERPYDITPSERPQEIRPGVAERQRLASASTAAKGTTTESDNRVATASDDSVDLTKPAKTHSLREEEANSKAIADVVQKLMLSPTTAANSEENPDSSLNRLNLPQSDSPELPPQPYSAQPQGSDSRSRSSQDDVASSVSEWGKKFRPNYSQSFTFQRRRHRHHHGETHGQDSTGEIADPADSGDDQRGRDAPKLLEFMADSQASQTGSGRPVLHRQSQPEQPDRQRRPDGFEQQPMSVSTNTRQVNYIYSSHGNAGDDAHSRAAYGRRHHDLPQQQQPAYPLSSRDQRRALTLGQSVARTDDGTSHQLQNGRGAAGTPTESSNNYSAQEFERRRLQQQQEYERQRQQQDYERQQEEYRRELLRRRQQYEQQKAAQDAEYQRRLEEHNRRLRQRQKEIEERRRLSEHHENNNNYPHSSNNGHPHHQNSRQRLDHPVQRQQHQAQPKPENQPVVSGDPTSRLTVIDRRNNPLGTYDARPRNIIPAGAPDRRVGLDVSVDEIRHQAYLEQLRQQQIEQQRHQQQQQQQSSSTFYSRGTNRRNPYAPRPDTRDRSGDRTSDPDAPQTSAPSTRTYLPKPAEGESEHKASWSTTVTVTSTNLRQSNPLSPLEGPVSPDDLPQDSRSSLTAVASASSDGGLESNELPDSIDSSLVVQAEKTPTPLAVEKNSSSSVRPQPDSDESDLSNAVERGPLIGPEEGSLRRGAADGMPYEWRVSGLTDCTVSCGGGAQQTVVVCLDTRTQAVVTDGNCPQLTRPSSKAVTCNTRPCPAEWTEGEWSPCTVTCGEGGVQTRPLLCQARISPTLNVSMPEENCLNSVRPEDRKACNIGPCWSWSVGNWSQCSVPCGEGVRTRQVICMDSTGFDVMESLCPGSKPAQEDVCDMGTCGKGWYFTPWPQQCPAVCGGGSMTRHVTCLGAEGQKLPDASCERSTRPEERKECRADGPCGGQWFIGEWEQCNVTCGAGYREREVVCMKALPAGSYAVVGEENCAAALKPEAWEACRKEDCLVEWYMTPWSECSQSCGTGQRTRQVKCLDPHQRPSSDCPSDRRPQTREVCDAGNCQAATKASTTATAAAAAASAVSSEECTDSFLRCDIVKRTRMCQSQYYRKRCCVTCGTNNT